LTTRFRSIADIHLMDRRNEGILGYEPVRYGRVSHLRICGDKKGHHKLKK
jgi:hypothetical protein